MLEKNEICLFFASDYHFEMISLPFINENLKKNKEIIILTENNLTETANKLISNINLKEEDKNKLREINWDNNDVEKITEKNDKEKIVFVKGNLEYNKKINKEINKLGNNENEKSKDPRENIQVINCFDINELGTNITNITKEYSKVLSTSGIKMLN